MKPINIVIVDDHPILRSGLKMLVNAQSDMQFVGEAENATEALALLAKVQPDIVILDIALPHTSGLQLLKELRARHARVRVLILTMHTDIAFLQAALSGGAAGFVLKQAADVELLSALRAVARGGMFIDPTLAKQLLSAPVPARPEVLSSRERQVTKLLAQGYGNQQIAARLVISVKTVETYRARLADKLGLRTRQQITRYALATGLLTIADALMDDDSAA